MAPRRRIERRSTRSDETRARVIAATRSVLGERGFAGATTQTIAERAGVAQGVIFYHFGTMNDLFVEVIRTSTAERFARYSEVLEESKDVASLLGTVLTLFREDKASGHVDAVAELIAGAGAVPALRAEVRRETDQWLLLVEQQVRRLTAGSPLEQLLPPPRQLVTVIAALYLGAELLDHFDPSLEVPEALGAVAERLTFLLSALGGGSSQEDTG